MNTKLTLRLDDELVAEAKTHAAQRGKSVSQMFGDFISSLRSPQRCATLPPVTRSLLGIIKDQKLTEADYKKHLRKKYS